MQTYRVRQNAELLAIADSADPGEQTVILFVVGFCSIWYPKSYVSPDVSQLRVVHLFTPDKGS
jgi:hypothetical protein